MGEAKRRRAMAQHMANSFPDDIKRDIAKTVRSIEWLLPDRRPAGMCFFRTMSGTITLNRLDIPAKPALGGMIYRAGPDEERDVVAFCGPGNAGTRIGSSFLGHWFIMSGDDIVDFSVGDWKALTAPGMLQDAELAGVTPLGSILWTGARPAGILLGSARQFHAGCGTLYARTRPRVVHKICRTRERIYQVTLFNPGIDSPRI